MANSTFTIACLRSRVTNACVDYIGSITIDQRFCDALHLFNRQCVNVYNENNTCSIETYVIYGRLSDAVPPGTICLNGAAAHLFNPGDIVCITANAQVPVGDSVPEFRKLDTVFHSIPNDVSGIDPNFVTVIGKTDEQTVSNDMCIPIVISKIHRARLTTVRATEERDFPISIALDQDWLSTAGIQPRAVGHVVNVTTGRRDVATIQPAPAGTKICGIYIHSKQHSTDTICGHNVGDVIIVMRYGLLPRRDVQNGTMPPLRLCFPFEAPVDSGAKTLNDAWLWSTLVLWDEDRLAKGLINLLKLRTPGRRTLDCSCGNAFPGAKLAAMGITLEMSDGSEEAVKEAKSRFTASTGSTPHEKNIRCVKWDRLAEEYGREVFDVIMLRGNSLPYVAGSWSAPSFDDGFNAEDGFQKLEDSLRGVYDTLAPGGILLVDCVMHTASANSTMFAAKHVTERNISANVSVKFRFSVDEKRMSRRFESWVKVINDNNGEAIEIHNDVWGLLVREPELRDLLNKIGFEPVVKAELEGEDVYQPFLAFKPNNQEDGLISVLQSFTD